MILAARVKSLALAVAVFAALPAFADAPPSPPQFGSLSRDKVYLREGPSYQHRVLWIYRRAGLPVKILTKYDIWYRVEDSDGTIGWLSNVNAAAIAYAQHGVVAKLEACKALVCEVSVDGTDGWIKKTDIWGVGVGEVFK